MRKQYRHPRLPQVCFEGDEVPTPQDNGALLERDPPALSGFFLLCKVEWVELEAAAAQLYLFLSSLFSSTLLPIAYRLL